GVPRLRLARQRARAREGGQAYGGAGGERRGAGAKPAAARAARPGLPGAGARRPQEPQVQHLGTRAPPDRGSPGAPTPEQGSRRARVGAQLPHTPGPDPHPQDRARSRRRLIPRFQSTAAANRRPRFFVSIPPAAPIRFEPLYKTYLHLTLVTAVI